MASEVDTNTIVRREVGASGSENPWSHDEEAQSPGASDSGSDYSAPRSLRGSLRSSRQLQNAVANHGLEPESNAAAMYTSISPVFADHVSRDSWSAADKPTEIHKETPSASSAEGVLETMVLDEKLPVGTVPTRSQTPSHSRSSSQATQVAKLINSPEMTSPVSRYSGSEFSPRTPTRDVSPITPHGVRASGESFASIALSESSLDYDHLSAKQVDDVLATPRVSSMRHVRKLSGLMSLQTPWGPTRQDTLFDLTKEEGLQSPYADDNEVSASHSSTPSVNIVEMDDERGWVQGRSSEGGSNGANTQWSSSGSEGIEVDWLALDKTEEQEKEDKEIPEGMEDESTKFLLARLEQENAKFTAAPKSGTTVNNRTSRARSNTRPPSMAQIKKLVQGKDNASFRYSLAPTMTLPDEPPPMTELEFWAALVQDYPSTAARLPTLTTTKIRSGIPPPLRGVVWTSMAGARDKSLEEAFETLQHEKSPYEGIINKDVGRSFPGVELFRDADGEGQRMLGKVLRCFSLQDQDIGYCQGLGFLVGPLLMNMGEKDAFCVLVRLMTHYALRPSFMPSLSGLHMRIFQFSTLLKQHHPELFAHLTELGVEPAYLSQWFLSCFAVTCPLSMLFRIYDVIFAEGANETVMRVALALFRRNEKKIMESMEFDEVMQLLLGRSLWDCYGFNADELVDDFTSLGNIITHERLAELEHQFENQSQEVVGQSAGFLPDVQAAASRFLGRLWTPSHLHTPSKGGSTSLSPQSAEKETTSAPGAFLRGNFLRRSPSKQSIGTLTEGNGEDFTSSGSASLASTVPTDSDIHDVTRESQADTASLKSKTTSVSVNQYGVSREQHDLHIQIEDLLMALSEAQREHARLATMLQKEREERNDDHRVVKLLVTKLQRGDKKTKGNVRRSMPPPPRPTVEDVAQPSTSIADKRRTLPSRPTPQPTEIPALQVKPSEAGEDVDSLVEQVEERLATNARFSTSFETKAHLRLTLARSREQLAAAEQNLKDLTERAEFAENSLMTFQSESESLRAEVEELRVRVNEEFRTRQKLELQVQNMEIQIKMEARSLGRRERLERTESAGDVPTLGRIDTSGGTENRFRQTSPSSLPSSGGLRELKLGRRDSVGSVASIRGMKSQRRASTSPAIALSPSPSTTSITEELSVAAEPAAPAIVSVTVNAEDSTPSQEPVSAAEPLPTASEVPTPWSGPAASAVPAVPAPSSASLSVPYHRTGFARRTSSLVTKDMFATPQHEPVHEDAVLVELVNAKTAEAQARVEVDELKRALALHKRQAEEAFTQMRAEADAIRSVAKRAREDAIRAREEAERARQEVFDASVLSTPALSWPATPALDYQSSVSASPLVGTPTEELKKYDTTPPPGAASAAASAASAVGGWFWGRRTASTAKASVDSST